VPLSKRPAVFLAGLIFLFLAITGCQQAQKQPAKTKPVIRLGFFPNVTHAAALYGTGTGLFAECAEIHERVFTAGPAEMEALLAGEVDLGYVGPGPAINAFVKSNGALVILSGAATGGAALVSRPDAPIQSLPDLAKKTVAVPQTGGTQDIALRSALQAAKITESVKIIAMAPADISVQFQRNAIDAAWVAEPWVSRLVSEQQARVILDERASPSCVLVARTEFLKSHPELVQRFLAVHQRSITQFNTDPKAIGVLSEQLTRHTNGAVLSKATLQSALARTTISTELSSSAVASLAEQMRALGYLDASATKLSGLILTPEQLLDPSKLSAPNRSALLLPSPIALFSALGLKLKQGILLPAIATSLMRVGLGYLAALLLGVPLGLLLARVGWLDKTLGAVVTGLQSLPSICWFPIALLWFGINEGAVFFVIVLGSVFAVTIAVRGGVRALPPLYLRAATAFRASGWQLWRFVLLPASLPAILSGMRQGWAMAWRSLMSAELLSQSMRTGVGHLLNTGRDLNDVPLVLAMILVILVLGIVVDKLFFLPVERWVARRWGTDGA
jgi:aliphatic sulfonates family ABC transporter substrate-binding protein